MKNVPNRATGEAMPSLTRRLFLRGAAIIAPLAALPTLPALAANTPDYVEENPALLALEPRVDAVEKAYDAAAAEFRRALDIGTALWPRAPRAIKEDKLSSSDRAERDIRGGGYFIGDAYDSVTVAKPQWIKSAMTRVKRRKNAAGTLELLRQELALAEAYEAECENALTVSGFHAADAAKNAAAKDLEAVVRLVRAEPAKTMAGVAIKARAFCAWGKVPAWYRVMEGVENNLAGDVAASLLAILNDQSA